MLDFLIDLLTPIFVSMGASAADVANYVRAAGGYVYAILGIIAAFLFKKFKHTRNYKKCMKGAVAGFAVIGVILLIFLLLLWRVVA